MNGPAVLAITDPDPTSLDDVVAWAVAVLCAGVPSVQVRLEARTDREILRVLVQIRSRLDDGTIGAPPDPAAVLVNGRPDLALAAGWRGVHLPSAGLPVGPVRRLMGRGARIGRSTHSVEEVLAAEAEGADYAILGPIFDTPSKRSYGPPLGLDVLRDAAGRVLIPVLAIGGIDRANARTVIDAGAAGIAAIRLFRDPAGVPALLDAIGVGNADRPAVR